MAWSKTKIIVVTALVVVAVAVTSVVALKKHSSGKPSDSMLGNMIDQMETSEMLRTKALFQRDWLLAFILYANEHKGQFPDTFDQARGYLSSDIAKNSKMADEMEIVYHGSRQRDDLSQIIALREVTAHPNAEGASVKVYGLADGSVQALALPFTWQNGATSKAYDSFAAFESDQIVK